MFNYFAEEIDAPTKFLQKPSLTNLKVSIIKFANCLCRQNNASVEWSYFAQKYIKFTCSHASRFEEIFPESNHRTPAYKGGERKGRGIKWFLHGRDWEGKKRGGEREGKGVDKGDIVSTS